MKTLLNTTDFSDCNHADFGHYFGGCAMVWDLPSITPKRRLFIAGEIVASDSGKVVISGQYLTKLKEWKEKRIAFSDWHKRLTPVAIRDMYFPVGRGVTLYSPNLQRNLKKAPRWDYRGMTHFGATDPEQQTTQHLSWWAFRDLYEREVEPSRKLWQILLEPNDQVAECDERGFIVERVAGGSRINYRSKKVGIFNPNTRVIAFQTGSKLWINYLKSVEDLGAHGITFRGE